MGNFREVIEKATVGEDIPVKVPTDFFGQPIVKKQGAAPRTRIEGKSEE